MSFLLSNDDRQFVIFFANVALVYDSFSSYRCCSRTIFTQCLKDIVLTLFECCFRLSIFFICGQFMQDCCCLSRRGFFLSLYNPACVCGTWKLCSVVWYFSIGMSHKPSDLLRLPRKITSWFFMTARSCWSRTTLLPSLHNCPIEIKEALLGDGKIVAACATGDSWFDSGTVPLPVVVSIVLSGCRTLGPFLVCTSWRMVASCGRK